MYTKRAKADTIVEARISLKLKILSKVKIEWRLIYKSRATIESKGATESKTEISGSCGL